MHRVPGVYLSCNAWVPTPFAHCSECHTNRCSGLFITVFLGRKAWDNLPNHASPMAAIKRNSSCAGDSRSSSSLCRILILKKGFCIEVYLTIPVMWNSHNHQGCNGQESQGSLCQMVGIYAEFHGMFGVQQFSDVRMESGIKYIAKCPTVMAPITVSIRQGTAGYGPECQMLAFRGCPDHISTEQ
jgi:hypothetical protein